MLNSSPLVGPKVKKLEREEREKQETERRHKEEAEHEEKKLELERRLEEERLEEEKLQNATLLLSSSSAFVLFFLLSLSSAIHLLVWSPRRTSSDINEK